MFEVQLHIKARKSYERLPKQAVLLVDRGFALLESDPFSGPQIKRLHGPLAGLYRLRAGRYRIVYQIINDHQIVVVLVIGSRESVY